LAAKLHSRYVKESGVVVGNFWKDDCRSRKFWKGRSCRRSRTFYLRLRNPGFDSECFVSPCQDCYKI